MYLVSLWEAVAIAPYLLQPGPARFPPTCIVVTLHAIVVSWAPSAVLQALLAGLQQRMGRPRCWK